MHDLLFGTLKMFRAKKPPNRVRWNRRKHSSLDYLLVEREKFSGHLGLSAGAFP